MYSNRSLFKSCLWTAHGFKTLPPTISADWILDDTKTPVPAMPHLDELFTPGRLDELIVDLFGLARYYFDRSLTVTENVTRIPIKVGEQQLPGTVADRLRYFTPVDIYDHEPATFFCIPCIQDYGAALKGQEWHIFLDCYLRMLVFYLGCSSKGECRNSFMICLLGGDYTRAMFVFDHLL